MTFRSLVLSLIAPVAFVAAATAQERSTASFRFVSFDPADNVPLFAESSGRWVPVDHPSNRIGSPVRLKLGPKIAVFDKKPGDAESKAGDKSGAKPEVKPLFTFKPVDAPRQLVLLFRDQGAHRAVVIPDTGKTFPYGTCLIFNMTDKALRFSHGDAVTSVPAGGMRQTSEPKQLTSGGDAVVKINVEGAPNDGLVYSTVWVHNSKVRTMVFVLRDASGSFLVRQIRSADVPSLNEAAGGDEESKKAGSGGASSARTASR